VVGGAVPHNYIPSVEKGIRIILTDEIEIKRREKGASKKTKKPARATTGKSARKGAPEAQSAPAEATPAAPTQEGQSKE
jgi:hypothetical protein